MFTVQTPEQRKASSDLARFIRAEMFQNPADAKAYASREIDALPGTRAERTDEQHIRFVALNMVIRGEA